jgi:predicted RNase H-like HicB family nuclease
MGDLIEVIHVNVEYLDGHEEGDVGYPHFMASCEELNTATDAESFEELFANIQQMLERCLKTTGAHHGIDPDAIIKINFEMTLDQFGITPPEE